LAADALTTVRAVHGRSAVKPLLRADSAFYGAPTGAGLRGAVEVSVTVRLDPNVKKAIAVIGKDACTPIEYSDAVDDEQTRMWLSRTEVAEVDELPATMAAHGVVQRADGLGEAAPVQNGSRSMMTGFLPLVASRASATRRRCPSSRRRTHPSLRLCIGQTGGALPWRCTTFHSPSSRR